MNAEGNVDLISNMVKSLLKIDCLVVMGANLANEVAAEQFCEATIGNYYWVYIFFLFCSG